MKAKSIHLAAVMTAALSLVLVPTMAQATGLSVPDYIPESSLGMVTTIFSLVTTVIGTAAAIDAFIPEDAKKILPWWLRLAWDFIAGNVFHSKNVGSDTSAK